jgi:proteic killer suppression protein
MIQSIKNKPLRLLFEKDDVSKIRPDFIRKVENILTRLHAAKEIKDMNAPGYNLHQLTGNRKGTWSITIKENWRITFQFENGDAFEVNMEDYH